MTAANKNIWIVVLLSILPFIFVFSTRDFFYTQDGWAHLARGAAYFKALLDGQFPVRWVGDLNYSYGMPLFNFVYQIPYILMSALIFLGLGLSDSFKIVTFLSFIFSGVFMYLFAFEFFKDKQKALLVTIFYQFFPFRLVDMFVRGGIGEMFTFTFLPLILYGVVLFFKKPSNLASIIIAMGTFGITLSHLATGGVFLLVSGLFAIIFSPKIKSTLLIFTSMLLGLGLSSYYLLPALVEHKYTYGSFFAKDLYMSHFVPFVNFFVPNFLNDPGLRIGDVPIQIGIFHVLAILMATSSVAYFKKIKLQDKKLIVFCAVIIAVSLFMMQPVSKFIWQNVPLFSQFQFPWRFLAVVGFGTSMLAFYFSNFVTRKILYMILIILVVGSTAYYWYPQLGFRKIDEKTYWDYPLNTTYFGEVDLVWSAGPASSYPKERVEIIEGEAIVQDVYKKSNLHTYKIDAKTPSKIVDHTQFYPGWRVFVDNKSVPIQFQDPNHRGEITFPVPSGTHTVRVSFSETITRMVTDIISLVSFLAIVILLFVRKFKVKLSI